MIDWLQQSTFMPQHSVDVVSYFQSVWGSAALLNTHPKNSHTQGNHAANTQENSTLWLYRNFLKGCYISLERWFYKDQENWGCNFQKFVRLRKLTLRGPIWPPLGFSQFFSKPAKIFQKKTLHGLRDFNLWSFDGRFIVGGWPYPKLWEKYKKPYLRFHRFCL